ncbi:MAG: CYTH domain-containing protein [Stomatobaculum sp.]
MEMEIERKFRPAALPEKLSACPSRRMIQGYLCTAPVVRVRREGNARVLTVKGSGLMIREEHSFPLSEESFLGLLQKCEGQIIEKTRYYLPVEGYPALTAELDVFAGAFAGLVLLEVEFPSEEAARRFTPPSWYGTEVTDNPAYQNASLSRGILPGELQKNKAETLP